MATTTCTYKSVRIAEGESHMFYLEPEAPLLVTPVRSVTVGHGIATLHLTRESIRELAALLIAAEEHYEQEEKS